MKSARLNPRPGLELLFFAWSNRACRPAFLDLALFLLFALAAPGFWESAPWEGAWDKDEEVVAGPDGVPAVGATLPPLAAFFTFRLRTGSGAGNLTSVSLLQ